MMDKNTIDKKTKELRKASRGLFIRFFDESTWKKVFWKIEDREYYLIRPTGQARDYAEISTWSNIEPDKDLWVNIVSGNNSIILKATDIEALAKELRGLRQNRIWVKKGSKESEK
jgi:hypothetical protein